ncbi:unnamed protein product [Sphacelaria rigidula]
MVSIPYSFLHSGCPFRQIHEEIGGTGIQRFVNQELGKPGKITTQGLTFSAKINTRLPCPAT